MIERNSTLSQHNKFMWYKHILKPFGLMVIICGAVLVHVVITSLRDFGSIMVSIPACQYKVLRGIVEAPWYIRNSNFRWDVNMDTIE